MLQISHISQRHVCFNCYCACIGEVVVSFLLFILIHFVDCTSLSMFESVISVNYNTTNIQTQLAKTIIKMFHDSHLVDCVVKSNCCRVWLKSYICRSYSSTWKKTADDFRHWKHLRSCWERRWCQLYYDAWTHPEDPVLLQTPSSGLLSAKLSVFRGPEEEEESQKEADEKQNDLHTTKRDIL